MEEMNNKALGLSRYVGNQVTPQSCTCVLCSGCTGCALCGLSLGLLLAAILAPSLSLTLGPALSTVMVPPT